MGTTKLFQSHPAIYDPELRKLMPQAAFTISGSGIRAAGDWTLE